MESYPLSYYHKQLIKILSSCLQKLDGRFFLNPLSANPEKWSNTLKQIVGSLPTICLSVFDHFMNLVLKGLKWFYKCFRVSKQTLP